MVNWKYIAIIITIIAVVATFFILRNRKSLSFDFNLGDNISSILNLVNGRVNQVDLTNSLGGYVNVPLSTTIKNNKSASVVLNNVLGALTYEGQPIITTDPNSSVLNKVTIPGNQSTVIKDNAMVLINPTSLKFLTELVKGNKPQIKYNFSTTILGKTYTFNNTSTVNKS